MIGKTPRRAMAAGLAFLTLTGAAAGIAAATSSGDDDPAFTSSVTVPAGVEMGEHSQELQSLARISAAEAEAKALEALPGTVEETELENEAGNVVYSVEIADAAGKLAEVTVDAGNGAVLSHEDESDDDGEADDEDDDDEDDDDADDAEDDDGEADDEDDEGEDDDD